MAKNPWMSAYLSAWNKTANTGRGAVTGAMKAEQKRTSKQLVDAWFDAFTPPSAKKAAPRKSAAKRTTPKRGSTAKKSTARRKPATGTPRRTSR